MLPPNLALKDVIMTDIRAHILNTKGKFGRTATKTKGLDGKPAADIFGRLLASVRLETIEGNQPVKHDSIICIGISGEPWQQKPGNIAKKYIAVATSNDGWTRYEPVVGNAVDYFEVTAELAAFATGYHDNKTKAGFIVGTYGDTIDGVDNMQAFNVGDIIARDPSNHIDQWVVARKIWENSYEDSTAS